MSFVTTSVAPASYTPSPPGHSRDTDFQSHLTDRQACFYRTDMPLAKRKQIPDSPTHELDKKAWAHNTIYRYDLSIRYSARVDRPRRWRRQTGRRYPQSEDRLRQSYREY